MTTTTQIRWHADPVDPVLGQIWWADLGYGDTLNIAQIVDPIQQKLVWTLDFNSREIGRYDSVLEAQEAAGEYF